MEQQASQTTQLSYLVIFNENSGPLFYNNKKIIQQYLHQHGIASTIHNTRPDGSFLNLNPHHFEKILVAGGDGTLKEVANWIIKNNSTTPLAIIPHGSGNIVAQSLGIPLSLSKALDVAVHGTPRYIDAGLINRREYFILAAGLGFDAAIIRNTPRKLKRFFGIFAYGHGLVSSFFNSSANKFFIKSDEYEGVVRAQSLLVSNIGSFLNFKVHPHASIHDGYLNVSIFKPLNAVKALQTLYKILKGDYDSADRYQYFNTKHIYILPYKKYIPMQVDGDLVTYHYFDIQVVPNALRIITNKEL